DGKHLLVGLDAGALEVRDLAGGERVRSIPGPGGLLFAVALSPDGTWLALVSRAGFRLVDLHDGRALPFPAPGNMPPRCFPFHPGGGLSASGDRAGVVRLWRLPSCEMVAELRGHPGTVLALAFSPDGRLLASAGVGTAVRLWRVPGGELDATFPRHGSD